MSIDSCIRSRMHIPSLENIYQTISKQRDILNRQKLKINWMKSKLSIRDNHATNKTVQQYNNNVNSLADSMYSLTLVDQIIAENEKLSAEKWMALRRMLHERNTIMVTKSKRPTQRGLNSEVVVEKLLANGK